MLKQSAYLEYCENVKGPQVSFDMWDQYSKTVPLFKFWSTVLDIELLITRFAHSLREGDFKFVMDTGLFLNICEL